MKKVMSNLLNIFSVIAVILIVSIIVIPFHLMNLDYAQRIAKWKSEYEQLVYSFNLIKLYEGKIVESESETGRLLYDDYMYERIKPFFNTISDNIKELPDYHYKEMNGKPVLRTDKLYFNKFMYTKDGAMLGFKKVPNTTVSDTEPIFYMFFDINGAAKPNVMGEDIFFLNIFQNDIKAMGMEKSNICLKTNCSPVGTGAYCSAYYLLGGRF